MKKTYIITAVVVLLGIAFYLYGGINKKSVDEQGVKNSILYSNAELGLSFNYLKGSDGYILQETTPTDDGSDLVRVIVLIPNKEALQQAPVGGEGPATISIQVFKNSKKQWSRTWADEHTQYSNINLKIGDVLDTVVGGANAIQYMADGLYTSENFVVAHGDYVYVFSGMFVSEDSALRRDFSPLIKSVQFIKQSEPTIQGKIDINAVCEGALAYMTFPDGTSAEVFVKNCKEGKHPEVIERFKNQMNLGDGAEI